MAQLVNPPTGMPASQIRVPTQIPAAPLTIQFSANVSGKTCQVPESLTPMWRPGWNSWLWPQAWPSLNQCSHLGIEQKKIVFPLSLFLSIIKGKKVSMRHRQFLLQYSSPLQNLEDHSWQQDRAVGQKGRVGEDLQAPQTTATKRPLSRAVGQFASPPCLGKSVQVSTQHSSFPPKTQFCLSAEIVS